MAELLLPFLSLSRISWEKEEKRSREMLARSLGRSFIFTLFVFFSVMGPAGKVVVYWKKGPNAVLRLHSESGSASNFR